MLCRLWALLLLCWISPVSAGSVDDVGYRALHDLYRAPWLDRTMEWITRLGDLRLQLTLCAGMAAYGRNYERETARLQLVAFVCSGLIVSTLKELTDRPRPEYPNSRDSFPSGHSAIAWAGASLFGRRYPKYRWAYYITASLVSLSRVYLGKHYPSDVLIGAIIGYGTAELAWHYRERIWSLRIR
ncbi:MAG: hypothetical protein DRP95_04605 [Candidatus Latescibacterota bacterium]|nr:MAG: hypothetical protein DRP95_04605 [Candidatus Latescibacterota bacterium]